MLGGKNDGLVSSNGGHRGKRVHRLCPSDAWDQLHSKSGEPVAHDRLQRGRLVERLQKSQDHRARLQFAEVIRLRPVDTGQHVRLAQKSRAVREAGSGSFVLVIEKAGLDPGSGFNSDFCSIGN